MSNTYNIYKVRNNRLDDLKQKLELVGLAEQKTIESKNYSLKFYFSNNVDGNKIWWWLTYRNFFNDDVEEPKNFFYFGVLLCINIATSETVYAVSLGKSHFYLSKSIHSNFGIHLAVRMADDNTILLKKSRYFAGTKRQDVSSYARFQKDNYEAGESVEHLKLKAADKKIWGEKNIIFADSIQMDIATDPLNLPDIFDQIDIHLMKDEIIQLPKLEPVEGDLLVELDKVLFESLKNADGEAVVEEFTVHGVVICFNFHDYEYRLSAKIPDGDKYHTKKLGNSLEIDDIKDFFDEFPDIVDVNSVRVQFSNEENGTFTKGLKEVVDIPIDYEDSHYFLRNGEWFKFNQTFMEYLKKSLNSIETVISLPLKEKDYLTWKAKKESDIASGVDVDDKLTYRESYFNKDLCDKFGFELLDRQLTLIQSMEKSKKKYKVEVADLYKDNEIISVKISDENHDIIYNIEQSKDSIELIKRGEIEFKYDLKCAALWFVFEDDVNKITEFNSIQFLLALEAWQKMVKNFGLTPKIYISKHEKT